MDLVFGKAGGVLHSPVDLVFGLDEADAVLRQFTLAAQLPALTFAAEVSGAVEATLEVAFAALTFAATAAYRSDTQRPLVGTTRSEWQTADRRPASLQSRHRESIRLPAPVQVAHQVAARLSADRLFGVRSLHRFPRALASGWQDGDKLRSSRASAWRQLIRMPLARVSRWQVGEPVRASTGSSWQEMIHDRRPVLRFAHQVADSLHQQRVGAWHVGAPMSKSWRHGERSAIRPPAGTSTVPPIVVPPDEPCYTPAVPVHLAFKAPWSADTNLVFVCENHPQQPGATVVVPIRRVYFVINETSLRRVDGNVPIHCESLSMSLDSGSWTWGVTATVPASALDVVEPDSDGVPIELEASINGVPYRFFAEGLRRDRVFPTEKLAIQGRGKSALLDAPYAPVLTFGNSFDRTAQQLVADALTFNGVPLGWDVDWSLTDWLVPAGAWAHQGSYITAVNAIAAAAGGYVQPHPSDELLRILPRYPVAPWDWAGVTPDFELPPDVMSREGIDWRERARYNRVFVSGMSTGVLCQVTRAGTAGDLVAPMVTDSLITHVDAGRQRGLLVLAETGRIAYVSLRLPVLAETGIIVPGAFVRYLDSSVTRQGLVRSTGVEVGNAEVWQTIGVETHA